MRKLIVTNIVSLDGCYEGPGGNVMALPMDSAFDAYCAERLGAADTLLLGRKSFELFSRFWPPVADNPDATPAQRTISRRDNAIDKLVISDSLTAEDTGVWRESTRIVSRADAQAAIKKLKQGSAATFSSSPAERCGTTSCAPAWSMNCTSSSALSSSATERPHSPPAAPPSSSYSTPGRSRTRTTSLSATPSPE